MTNTEPEFTQEETDRYHVMQIISDTTDLRYGEAMSLADRIVQALKSDDELDDLEYYDRYGFSRTAPVCNDSDCPCEN